MDMSNMLSGAINLRAVLDHLKNGKGGSIVVINHGSSDSEPDDSEEMISNGAPPAMGGHADAENTAEQSSEGPGDEGKEDGGMMGAVKAGLSKMKEPSKGIGKGPAPGTADRMKKAAPSKGGKAVKQAKAATKGLKKGK